MKRSSDLDHRPTLFERRKRHLRPYQLALAAYPLALCVVLLLVLIVGAVIKFMHL
jgi:hypothetical protein